MADPETIEADDNVTVVVPPEAEVAKTPEADQKPDDKADPAVARTREPVADLAEQFKAAQDATDRERSRREAVERQIMEERRAAAHLAQERDHYRHGMTSREAEVINAGINAAENERLAAKSAFKNAFDAGDSEAMAEAQAQMADASTRKLRFSEAKYELEARFEQEQAERQQPQQQPQPQPQQQPADQFEAYLGQFTKPTADWMRDHRDWVTDGKKNAKLQSAHYDAVANGIAPDTDDYFSHVERHIGLTEAAKTNGGAVKPTARRGPPAAPPVSGARSGGAVGGESVTLTSREALAATDGTHVWEPKDIAAGRIRDKALLGQPIGNQEFARRKLAMTKEGHYDRSYTEQ